MTRMLAPRALAILTAATAGLSAAPAARGQEDGHRAAPLVRWSPERVVEGTLFTIVIEAGPRPLRSARGSFAGQPLHFGAEGPDHWLALAAAPLDSAGSRTLHLMLEFEDGGGAERQLTLEIAAGEYTMQRLTVAPEFGRPQPPEIQRRIREETARAVAVSHRSLQTPRLWAFPFRAPRASRITSGFGHGRMFNGQVQSRHTGTDFAGALGAPVHAAARGHVALVDDFYLAGRVIYLDHGGGLVTAYLHLSEQLVVEGEMVEAGQLIGRVGASGRVTGPHLHWIVRYGNYSVDGQSLLALPAPPAP